jgi:GNAT superfamily N-acetyltransferase
MPFEIVPLRNKHLEDAAQLACRRYQALRAQAPLLPSSYGEVDTLLPMLLDILDAGPAVAALRGSQLAGFMAAWLVPSFRGRRATFSPEWANGALLEDSARTYEAMYTHLSAPWVANGYATHLVSALANDTEAVANWPWMGFGMIATDAIRDLSPLSETGALDVEIRRAGIDDRDAFMELEGALARYLADAPTFLVGAAPDTPAEATALLQDPARVVWLATEGEHPVAYLLIGPANDDASTIIYDEGTCSIMGAFTRPEARGSGVATAVLNRALSWARQAGYARCAVDFEPMNPLARRFWLSTFTPVCYSFARTVG